MNFMKDDWGDAPEPAIMLLGFDKKNYYLLKGEEHLDQMLLADGEYPKPVLCVNFASMFDAVALLGEDFSVTDLWAIHPEIVDRLRATESMIETDG